MLVGLTVSFHRGENLDHVEASCDCRGLNITSQSPRHVGESSVTFAKRRPLLPTERCHSPTQRLCLLQETFDPEVLFNLFLPPVIFHGLKSCVYGVTRLMVLMGRAADGDFLLTDCLLFGAIVSATDPVAVLGLLSEPRLDLDLRGLLFGESVLNDAVAIVLTRGITTYSQMGAGRPFDPPSVLLSVGYFLAVFAGSLLLGFTFTITTALLTKFTRLHENPLLETSVFFLLYRGGAVLWLEPGRTRTKQLFEVFNLLGEIFIFSFVGYVLLTFPRHVFKALFVTGAFVSFYCCMMGHLYPLLCILWTPVSPSLSLIMQSTRFRGAVAFSLAVRDTSTEARRTILSTTLLLVGFTTWVLGPSADPMLRLLNIR
nr:LOW QUALITY PROTEIN: sodium/hydrogen exchanger 7-like [Pseudochaenichthys georgianus]